MKRFMLASIALILFLLPIYALAHSGRTDSSGGHMNHSTGTYHYHHGYPAHSHTNGKCPYDFDDKTGQNSGSSSYSSSSSVKPTDSTSPSDERSFWEKLLGFVEVLIIGSLFFVPFFCVYILGPILKGIEFIISRFKKRQ